MCHRNPVHKIQQDLWMNYKCLCRKINFVNNIKAKNQLVVINHNFNLNKELERKKITKNLHFLNLIKDDKAADISPLGRWQSNKRCRFPPVP